MYTCITPVTVLISLKGNQIVLWLEQIILLCLYEPCSVNWWVTCRLVLYRSDAGEGSAAVPATPAGIHSCVHSGWGITSRRGVHLWGAWPESNRRQDGHWCAGTELSTYNTTLLKNTRSTSIINRSLYTNSRWF